LLADLLLHAGGVVSSDRLIDDLWGDRPPANPEGALQQNVSRLRRALEAGEPGAGRLVESRPGGYALRIGTDAVDAGRFDALVSAARARETDDSRTAALLGEALVLWRGPALAEFVGQPFARGETARLEERRLVALEDHIEMRLALGEHGSLIDELDALVADHPLRERLRGLHMRALYRAGRQAEALDSYQRLRTHLAGELGLDPSPELGRLYEQILAQDPALDAPADAGTGLGPRSNVPAQLSSLVGRAEAVEHVRQLLTAHRLVTLTGPGGVGKTRVALETAAQMTGDLPDGTWVAELAGQAERPAPDLMVRVAEIVAEALGVRDDGGPASGERAGLIDRLVAALHTKRLLLVLDNCEHAIEPVAKLADLLLRSAPGLRILATSRQSLGLTGEVLWSTPPLEVPAATVDRDLERFSAVRLFAERAGAVTPGFAVTAETAGAVAAICRRLDGLPLALELAAARTRVLPVHDLAARLDDRFAPLASARHAPPRQQTLRATIDWSWELLSNRERAVLRRLAVCAGGWTLAAAEAICAGPDVAAPAVLDLVAQLVDHSLVVAGQGPDGARYRLLETIRAYALERLDEAGETEPTRQRHAAFYTELAEAGDAQLRGRDQDRWLQRLDAETPNLRSALEWAIERGASDVALRLVNAAAWYWFLRGRHTEACRWLALAAGRDGPVVLRARALAWLGAFGSLVTRGAEDPARHSRDALELLAGVDEPLARAHAQLLFGGAMLHRSASRDHERLVGEALDTIRQVGDRWGMAAALSTRGFMRHRHGDLAGARRDGEDSRALFLELGDRWGQVRAADLLSLVAEIRGDYDEAVRMSRTALAMGDELGLWGVVAWQSSRLGRIALLVGDHAAAFDWHERSLRLARELGLEPAVTYARVGLGLVARRQGRLDVAEEHLRAVLNAHRAEGYRPGVAFCLAQLGFIAELRGDAQQARALHLEGLASARLTGDPRAVALALEGLAGAGALAGELTDAAVLLGVASTARESAGALLPPAERGDVDRITGLVRAGLGEHDFTTAFQRGAAMGLEQCLAIVDKRARGTVVAPSDAAGS
jgi:predicted ATPase/DNA-binding SARP family transcriptional activator